MVVIVVLRLKILPPAVPAAMAAPGSEMVA
jgi:hypothetical protein